MKLLIFLRNKRYLKSFSGAIENLSHAIYLTSLVYSDRPLPLRVFFRILCYIIEFKFNIITVTHSTLHLQQITYIHLSIFILRTARDDLEVGTEFANILETLKFVHAFDTRIYCTTKI